MQQLSKPYQRGQIRGTNRRYGLMEWQTDGQGDGIDQENTFN